MQKIGAQVRAEENHRSGNGAPQGSRAGGGGRRAGAADRPDSVLVEDEDGNEMVAYRLDVTVYAVTRGRGRPEAALARSLEGENGQMMVQREGGRITGIIYVPEPGDEPRGEATRADDI